MITGEKKGKTHGDTFISPVSVGMRVKLNKLNTLAVNNNQQREHNCFD